MRGSGAADHVAEAGVGGVDDRGFRETCTDSDRLPTWSVDRDSLVVSTCSVTFSTTDGPEALHLDGQFVGAGRHAVERERAGVSDCVVRDRPVAGLAIVTFAPGRAIFCASMIFPCRVAVPLCARRRCGHQAHARGQQPVTQCCLLIVSPPQIAKTRSLVRSRRRRIRLEGVLADAWVVVVRAGIGRGTNPRRVAAKRMSVVTRAGEHCQVTEAIADTELG